MHRRGKIEAEAEIDWWAAIGAEAENDQWISDLATAEAEITPGGFVRSQCQTISNYWDWA